MKKIVFIFNLFGIIACAAAYKDMRFDSPNFKEGIFLNLERQDNKSFFTFLKMRFSTEWPSWPEWIASEQKKPLLERVDSSDVHLTHINHSTVLIQTSGLNILTDPIYSERCSPVSFAGPKRIRLPGVAFENLPKIDIILISHDHYDHLDTETINLLVKRDQPKIYLGLGVGKHLKETDSFAEMDWWQSLKFNENLEISFVPVQHFSGRTLFDRNTTLWGGFVIHTPKHKIYFGGDTGYAGHFRETHKRFGSMDIAILPIGAYAPRDFMKFAHMDPAESVQAHIDLQAKKSFGVHYGTFQLTAEPVNEPIELLKQVLADKKIPEDSFVTPEFGKTTVIK